MTQEFMVIKENTKIKIKKDIIKVEILRDNFYKMIKSKGSVKESLKI